MASTMAASTTSTPHTAIPNGTGKPGPALTVPLLINGAEEHPPLTIPVTNPRTSKTLWSAAAASSTDASRAIAAAAAAYPAWRATKPSFRRDIFLRAADLLAERGAEYASYMELETGAEHGFSAGVNIPSTVAMLRDIGGRVSAELSSGSVPVCAEEGKAAMVVPEPYGVVLGIAPWNAPFILGMRAVAYPLAAGNTVVLKGSELSPRCHWAVAKVLLDAGLPAGCLNLVFVRPQDAPEVVGGLISAREVRKVNFTGSTAVGRKIAEMAGRSLKPCLMELGGKNCAVVLDDADLEEAAGACVFGAFLHSGQICMSTDIVFAQRSVVDKLKALMTARTSAIFPNDKPAQVLVNPAGAKKNKDIRANALEKGATVFHGDANMQHESDTFLRPLILDGVKEGMDMFKEEAFGPTAAILPFDNVEEAIKIMNENDYGLSASVFTKDLAKAFKVARKIESGAVHINSMTVHDEVDLPHGGWQNSGWGRFNGKDGFHEFFRTKTITWKE